MHDYELSHKIASPLTTTLSINPAYYFSYKLHGMHVHAQAEPYTIDNVLSTTAFQLCNCGTVTKITFGQAITTKPTLICNMTFNIIA